MRGVLLLVAVLLTSSCTEDAKISIGDAPSGGTGTTINAEDVRTYEELQVYLDQKYGEIEELPVAALISVGFDTSVSYKYRLPDGREFAVPIIFTATNKRIVDPAFEFNSLPD